MEDAIIHELGIKPMSNMELRNAFGFRIDGYEPALDRAIQSLRKAGKIRFEDRRWVLATEPPKCTRCGGSGREP